MGWKKRKKTTASRKKKKGWVGEEIDIGRFRGLFVPLPLSESEESWSA